MSANTHMTVRLGDLVVVAFDWATQCSADPRNVPLLAARAVEYTLRRARKTTPARQASGLLPLWDFGPLSGFGVPGRRIDTATAKGGVAGR